MNSEIPRFTIKLSYISTAVISTVEGPSGFPSRPTLSFICSKAIILGSVLGENDRDVGPLLFLFSRLSCRCGSLGRPEEGGFRHLFKASAQRSPGQPQGRSVSRQSSLSLNRWKAMLSILGLSASRSTDGASRMEMLQCIKWLGGRFGSAVFSWRSVSRHVIGQPEYACLEFLFRFTHEAHPQMTCPAGT